MKKSRFNESQRRAIVDAGQGHVTFQIDNWLGILRYDE